MDIKIKKNSHLFKVRTSGIIMKDNKILVEQYRDTSYFTLPGGYVEIGEDSSSAIIREIKEEVGVRINKNNIHPLYDRYLVKERFNNHFMYPFYAVCNKEASEFKVQKEELSYVKWYSIDKVIEMIKEGNKELVFKKEEIPLFEKLKNIEL